MESQEKKIKKQEKRQNIQNAILALAATTALLSIAILAPNIIKMFAKMGIRGKRKRESISRARDKLLERGLLVRDKNGFLQITFKGRLQLGKRFEILKKPKSWDKKWRVLVFDIPEKRKRAREQIRKSLFLAGFYRLQDSVWIYPYNCEEYIALLKSEFRIGKDLLYMIVDSIENDRHLKENFALSD